MKSHNKLDWKTFLFGVLILATICFVVFVLAKSLDSKFALAIFGFITTILAASYQYKRAKEREVAGRLFETKAEIYQGIADLIKDITFAQKSEDVDVSEEELAKRLIDYRAKMIVWSSIDTLRAYDNLAKMEGLGVLEMFKAVAALYECMRKDLGHKDPKNSGIHIVLGNVTDAREHPDFQQLLKN